MRSEVFGHLVGSNVIDHPEASTRLTRRMASLRSEFVTSRLVEPVVLVDVVSDSIFEPIG
jgi:hypothetical protein